MSLANKCCSLVCYLLVRSLGFFEVCFRILHIIDLLVFQRFLFCCQHYLSCQNMILIQILKQMEFFFLLDGVLNLPFQLKKVLCQNHPILILNVNLFKTQYLKLQNIMASSMFYKASSSKYYSSHHQHDSLDLFEDQFFCRHYFYILSIYHPCQMFLLTAHLQQDFIQAIYLQSLSILDHINLDQD